ncbi:uncharacterized protein [Diadema antillarum]
MSMARVFESPVISRRLNGDRICGSMSKPRVCRQLFAERPDQEELDRMVEDAKDMLAEQQKKKWMFNFQEGKPLEGSNWQSVPEASVPVFYRSTGRSPCRRGHVSSARSSESAERLQSADFTPNGGPSERSNTDTTSAAAAARIAERPSGDETETKTLNSSSSNHREVPHSAPAPSGSARRDHHQRCITEYFQHRKRSRSTSESDTSPPKQRRGSAAPGGPDRPRSAPAAVATSS